MNTLFFLENYTQDCMLLYLSFTLLSIIIMYPDHGQRFGTMGVKLNHWTASWNHRGTSILWPGLIVSVVRAGGSVLLTLLLVSLLLCMCIQIYIIFRKYSNTKMSAHIKLRQNTTMTPSFPCQGSRRQQPLPRGSNTTSASSTLHSFF